MWSCEKVAVEVRREKEREGKAIEACLAVRTTSRGVFHVTENDFDWDRKYILCILTLEIAS